LKKLEKKCSQEGYSWLPEKWSERWSKKWGKKWEKFGENFLKISLKKRG
jgi:hypothetical protein